MVHADVLKNNRVRIRSALWFLPRRCWYSQLGTIVARFSFKKISMHPEVDIIDLDLNSFFSKKRERLADCVEKTHQETEVCPSNVIFRVIDHCAERFSVRSNRSNHGVCVGKE